MRAHVALILVACSKPAPAPSLDATALHRIFTGDDARRLEQVSIAPHANGRATYNLTWKDRQKPDHAEAEFPGTFTDEMLATGVMYSVGAAGHDEHLIAMTDLRTQLRAHDPTIAEVRVKQLEGYARYEVHRTNGKVDVAYGEATGKIVDEVRDAIPAPELVEVSSPYNEIRLATSPDGTTRLWGSTDRPGGPKGWNIWMSRRTGTGWSEPTSVSFDLDANDFDPAYSPDGTFVYFFSNRPGGAGGDDLYRVPVSGDTFGAVEHLAINTAGDEWAPTPTRDGLLFSTNVPKAKHDLYFAAAKGTGFATPAPLTGGINTPDHDEFDATYVGTDIVFSRSTDVENDPIALQVAHPSGSGYDAGVPLPDSINVKGGYTLGPAVDLHDPKIFYFSSIRPGGAGKLDIYRVRLPR